MLFSKNLAAGLAVAIGLLVHEAVAVVKAPSCCTNQCGKAVGLNKNGKKDCSAVLVKTVVLPTVTTTRHYTVTHTVVRHGLSLITQSTDITATATETETDVSISTSITTDVETAFSTDVSTVIETDFSTVTIPYPVTTATVLKKRTICSTKPAYARTCDSGAYTRACSCLGVKPYTVTKPAARKTVRVTRTAYTTVRTVATSLADPVTNTDTVTVTSFTTIVSGVEVVETSTITLATEVATTVTTVVFATATAAPAPPTCTGTGFKLRINAPGSTPDGQPLGFINSIGQGIYMRAFQAGGSPLTVDSSGNIVSWYSPTDIRMVVLTNAPPPYKAWFESDAANVHYPSKSPQPASCQLGSGPDYKIACKSGGADYQAAICQDPTYFEWELWIYNDPSQLVAPSGSDDHYAEHEVFDDDPVSAPILRTPPAAASPPVSPPRQPPPPFVWDKSWRTIAYAIPLFILPTLLLSLAVLFITISNGVDFWGHKTGFLFNG
ncbi:hypothetical protein Dda_7874 [Drechslerella dactyloides]|uniref:Uncharacterized protein n=1 Tax=Drechslerella dactyloides TaxID=74499 RepID=A0AAD6NF17_DREDA|nr:hypothetical protein Dda_7874 [Drechslerella dactyloides]